MKRRKHRPINAAAGFNAIVNSQPTPAADVTRIMVLIRTAYERLKVGCGTEFDYNRVAMVVNVGLIRAEAIDPALVAMFMEAGEAVLECERIRRRHGSYGFAGPHLLAMNAAMDLYEEILTKSSPNQIEAALTESARRINRGDFVTA